jgi:hypothetical protein
MRRRLVTPVLFVSAAVLYSLRLTVPFEADAEEALAQYGLYARNYDRFGYRISGFAPLNAAGPDLGNYPSVAHQIYSHRPPTVSLGVSLFYRLLGRDEASIRVPVILAALAALAVFRAVAARLLDSPWDRAATALLAFVPIYAYYAPVTVHQVFGLLGALLIYWAYLRWRERPDRGRRAVWAGVTFAACWLDWPAFYAAGAVAVLHAATSRERRWAGWVAPAAAAAAAGVFVGYLYFLDPEGRVPLKAFLASGAGHAGRAPVGIAAYLVSEGRELAIHFTLGLLGLAALGLARLRPRENWRDAAILSFLILGADEVLFPNMCWWHRYLTLPWAPAAALLGAGGLRALGALPRGRLLAGAAVLAFAAQAALVLHKRHTFRGYYEVERGLAAALARHTGPGDRILVRLAHDVHLRSFYADRFVVTYRDDLRMLLRQYVNAPEEGIDDAALIDRLSRPGHGFSWFVTASVESARGKFAWIRRLAESPEFPRSARREMLMETAAEPTPLVEFLRSHRPFRERDGFLFFDLREGVR